MRTSMYELVIGLHSALRWLVLALGLGVLGTSVAGLGRVAPFDDPIAAARLQREPGASTGGNRGLERLFVVLIGAVHSQVALGLILFLWVSPLVRAAMHAGFTQITLAPASMFFVVVHPTAMITGAVVLQLGRGWQKRSSGAHAHRIVFFSVVLWMAITLAAIPWPGMAAGRPWLRLP